MKGGNIKKPYELNIIYNAQKRKTDVCDYRLQKSIISTWDYSAAG